MSADPKELTDAVRAARDAVAELEEPLKTEAFKILLEKLISGGMGANGKTKQSSRSKSTSKGRTKPIAAKRDGQATPVTSTLKLDIEDLKKLKIYSERFSLQGTEQIAFVLANFIREHTSLQYVTPADIHYLYRQLISQKIKVTAVNGVADWVRAMNWLTAPSRRKEWLEKSEKGFVVSNSGLLRFHELEAEAEAASKAAKQ